MNEIHKQVLSALTYADGIINRAGNEHIDTSEWDEVCNILSALSLPGENMMFTLVAALKENPEAGVLRELQTYFGRFFDAQVNAVSYALNASETYETLKFGYDREFAQYVLTLKDNSHGELYDFVHAKLRDVKIQNPKYYSLITERSKGWYFETNWLDGVGGANNSLIVNRIKTLKDNLPRLVNLYDRLADSLSRQSLNALIKFWLTWDYKDWINLALYYCDVVDTQIFPFYDDEVFVDCGSYIGDTVLQFINATNQNYKRIYTYDISAASIEIIKKNLADYSNIEIRHKGTADTNTEMAMTGVDGAFHGNKLSASDTSKIVDRVKVVRLDDDITEPISFLKVDCEGMDKETLSGAKGHIQRTHPKIHVDAYHKLADIVDVPEMIWSFDPSYSIFLRLLFTYGEEPRFPIPAFLAV